MDDELEAFVNVVVHGTLNNFLMVINVNIVLAYCKDLLSEGITLSVALETSLYFLVVITVCF